MEIEAKLFKIAYKKLKSSLYYDKTQSIVRDKLVRFEAGKADIDEYLETLAEEFLCKEKRTELFENILSSITYYAFPKTLSSEKMDMIRNYSKSNIEIEDNQYFIDMDIRGHILGVLWLILIGYRLDEKMYEHSYGNRIRSKLYSEFSDSPTYSPYLFEPYFQQYEGWRDTAMDEALQHLHSDQDVVVLTLDFKRFYYSVDISRELMDGIYKDEFKETQEDSEELKVLNDFVYEVIIRYSAQFVEFNDLRILPIGFLPSNILANYALKNFDKAILDGWNPIYFGRYVDDVIVVDKIETNSDLFKRAQANELEAENIITYFLEQCSGWKGLNGIKCKNSKEYALLHKKKFEDDTYELKLNKLYNPVQNDKSQIVIKNDKVKIFYFKSGESDALITCFKETISKNKSEFRHMPEDEAIFQKDDYSKIYDLQNDETINKFRGITGISIDKFELSKLLGKHLRIGGLINDVRETGFETQIHKILTQRVIIENYNVWEKIVEILVINESWDALKKIVEEVLAAIGALSYNDKNILSAIKDTMHLYLNSTLCRALALVWGSDADEFINRLSKLYVSRKESPKFDLEHFIENRKAYCKTRMVDKSVMPIFIDMLDIDRIYKTEETANISNFAHMIRFCKSYWDTDYVYYPFLVTMYDFSMISCMEQLMDSENAFSDLIEMYNNQVENYVKSNYLIPDNVSKVKKLIQVEPFKVKTILDKDSYKDSYLVTIENTKRDKLRLAIANTRLDHNNFEKVVIDKPNRSYERYKSMSKIINEAIDEKADMLIMPESYMPYEWLTTVARTCARNNLAIVTGIEHIKIGKCIFNLTAVILPYEDLVSKSAFISFHLKTHYAPAEKQKINGYRLDEVKGNHYELYKWHGCYFPVYCCYELTSITERAIFQSYADFLVSIEWNKDVNYYSNILESLSRDIHCYCVQVNSSDYGDSRITKPSKTEEKDIMRTKGGINNTILVDEIDIAKMRAFQLKGYDLQAYDKKFKPTPPGFDPEVVLKKIKGEDII